MGDTISQLANLSSKLTDTGESFASAGSSAVSLTGPLENVTAIAGKLFGEVESLSSPLQDLIAKFREGEISVSEFSSAANALAAATEAAGHAAEQAGEGFGAAGEGLAKYSLGAQDIIDKQQAADAALANAQGVLAELQAAYDSGAVGANELARAAEAVQSALDKANPAAQETGSSVHDAGDHAHEASGGFGEMAEQLVKFGEALAVTEALKEFGAEALHAFDSMQKANNSLTALTGSAETAKEVIEGIEKIAATQPFSFPELAAAAQKMAAFGIEADKIPDLLTAAGNASRATGNGFDGIASALERVSITGQVTGRQLVQLGVNWEDLAKAAGQSVENTQALLKKGGQDAAADLDLLLKTVQDKFGEFSKVPLTIGESWIVLQNQMHTVFADIGAALAPIVQQIVGWLQSDLIPAIKSATEWFNGLPAPVKDIAVALGLLAAAVPAVAVAIGGFGLALSGMSAAMPALNALMAGLGEAMAFVGLSGGAAAAGEALAAEGATAMAAADEAATVAAGELAAANELAATAAGEAGLAGALGEAGIAAGAAAEGVTAAGAAATVAAPLLAGIAAVGLVAYFSGAGEAAADFGRALHDAFTVGDLGKPIQEALEVIKIGAGGVKDKFEEWSGITDMLRLVKAEFPGLSAGIEDFGKKAKEAWDKFGDHGFWETILPGLRDLKEGLHLGATELDYFSGSAAKTQAAALQVFLQMQGMGDGAKAAAGSVDHMDASVKTLIGHQLDLKDKLIDAQTTLEILKTAYETGTTAGDGYKVTALDIAAAQGAVDAATKALYGSVQQATSDFIKYSSALPFKQTSDDAAVLITRSEQIAAAHSKMISEIAASGLTVHQFFTNMLADAQFSMNGFEALVPPVVTQLDLVNGGIGKISKALQDVLATGHAPLDQIHRDFEAIGLSADGANQKLKDQLAAYHDLDTQDSLTLANAFDAWDKVSGAVSKLAKTDLPAATQAYADHVAQLIKVGAAEGEIEKAQALVLASQIQLAHENGQDASDQLIALDKIKNKLSGAGGDSLYQAYVDLQKINADAFADIAKSLGDAIVSGTAFGDVMVKVGKDIAKEFTTDLLELALKPVQNALKELIGSQFPGAIAGATQAAQGIGAMSASASASAAAMKAQHDAVMATVDASEGLTTAVTDAAKTTASSFSGLASSIGTAVAAMAALQIGVQLFTTVVSMLGDSYSAAGVAQNTALAGRTPEQYVALQKFLNLPVDPQVIALLQQISGTLTDGKATAAQIAKAIENEQKTIDDLKAQASNLNERMIAAYAAGNTALGNVLHGELQATDQEIATASGILDSIKTSTAGISDHQAAILAAESALKDAIASGDIAAISKSTAALQATMSTSVTDLAGAEKEVADAIISGNASALTKALGDLQTALAGQSKEQTAAEITAMDGVKASAQQIEAAIEKAQASLDGLKDHQAQLNQDLIVAIAAGDTGLATAIQAELKTVGSDINAAQGTLTQLQTITGQGLDKTIAVLSGVKASADQIATATKAAQDSIDQLQSKLGELNQDLIVAEAAGNKELVDQLVTQIGSVKNELSTATGILNLIQQTIDAGNKILSVMSGNKATPGETTSATGDIQSLLASLRQQALDLGNAITQAVAAGDSDMVTKLQSQLNNINGQISSAVSLLSIIQSATTSGGTLTAAQLATATQNAQKQADDLQAQLKDLNVQLVAAEAANNQDLVKIIEGQIARDQADFKTANDLLGQLAAIGLDGSAKSADVKEMTAQQAKALDNANKSLNDFKAQQASLQAQLIAAEAANNTTLVATIQKELSTVAGSITGAQALLKALTDAIAASPAPGASGQSQTLTIAGLLPGLLGIFQNLTTLKEQAQAAYNLAVVHLASNTGIADSIAALKEEQAANNQLLAIATKEGNDKLIAQYTAVGKNISDSLATLDKAAQAAGADSKGIKDNTADTASQIATLKQQILENSAKEAAALAVGNTALAAQYAATGASLEQQLSALQKTAQGARDDANQKTREASDATRSVADQIKTLQTQEATNAAAAAAAFAAGNVALGASYLAANAGIVAQIKTLQDSQAGGSKSIADQITALKTQQAVDQILAAQALADGNTALAASYLSAADAVGKKIQDLQGDSGERLDGIKTNTGQTKDESRRGADNTAALKDGQATQTTATQAIQTAADAAAKSLVDIAETSHHLSDILSVLTKLETPIGAIRTDADSMDAVLKNFYALALAVDTPMLKDLDGITASAKAIADAMPGVQADLGAMTAAVNTEGNAISAAVNSLAGLLEAINASVAQSAISISQAINTGLQNLGVLIQNAMAAVQTSVDKAADETKQAAHDQVQDILDAIGGSNDDLAAAIAAAIAKVMPMGGSGYSGTGGGGSGGYAPPGAGSAPGQPGYKSPYQQTGVASPQNYAENETEGSRVQIEHDNAEAIAGYMLAYHDYVMNMSSHQYIPPDRRDPPVPPNEEVLGPPDFYGVSRPVPGNQPVTPQLPAVPYTGPASPYEDGKTPAFGLGGHNLTEGLRYLHADEWVIPPAPMTISLPMDVLSRISVSDMQASMAMPGVGGGSSSPASTAAISAAGAGSWNIEQNITLTANGVNDPAQFLKGAAEYLKSRSQNFSPFGR